MNPNIVTYFDKAARFSAVVGSVRDLAAWDQPSPCAGWTTRDVVHHVVDSQRDFLANRGADVGLKWAGTPAEVWTNHLTMVDRVVAADGFVTEQYDGYFGRTSVAETLADFYGFDLVVHRWDLGRGLGQDVAFDQSELDRLEASIAGFGDALYSDGVCGPAVTVPDDAPRQARVLGLLGRRAPGIESAQPQHLAAEK